MTTPSAPEGVEPYTPAEVDRARTARHLLPEPCPEVVGRLIATVDALRAERGALAVARAALTDLRDFGCRHDTSPTQADRKHDETWWCDYARSMDRSVRNLAAAALAFMPTPSQEPPSDGAAQASRRDDTDPKDGGAKRDGGGSPSTPTDCLTCGGTGTMEVLARVEAPNETEVYEQAACAECCGTGRGDVAKAIEAAWKAGAADALKATPPDALRGACESLRQHLQLALDSWAPVRGADADDDSIMRSIEESLDKARAALSAPEMVAPLAAKCANCDGKGHVPGPRTCSECNPRGYAAECGFQTPPAPVAATTIEQEASGDAASGRPAARERDGGAVVPSGSDSRPCTPTPVSPPAGGAVDAHADVLANLEGRLSGHANCPFCDAHNPNSLESIDHREACPLPDVADALRAPALSGRERAFFEAARVWVAADRAARTPPFKHPKSHEANHMWNDINDTYDALLAPAQEPRP